MPTFYPFAKILATAMFGQNHTNIPPSGPDTVSGEVETLTPKLIIIAGPTATGKTDLAWKLAKKFRGEIISADSRAIYKGLNIGTAKPPGTWIRQKIHDRGFDVEDNFGIKKARQNPKKIFISHDVPHHLIDLLSPKKTFSAANFAKKARWAITDIQSRGHLPIVVGGTGFWIDALLDKNKLASVPPNPRLRWKLEKLSNAALLKRLKKLDPKRAKVIDGRNKRRLIRAIEIAIFSRSPTSYKPPATSYDILCLGLSRPNVELKKRIRARFSKWLRAGLIAETKKLKSEISKKRLAEIGLAYPIVAEYLNKEISKDQMIEGCVNAIYHYAKRQKTWFKKNKKILWISSFAQAEKLTSAFLH